MSGKRVLKGSKNMKKNINNPKNKQRIAETKKELNDKQQKKSGGAGPLSPFSIQG